MATEEEEEVLVCPLCVEDIDASDRNFLPCPCGYRVCMWCWHHIKENLNNLCPACRTPYAADPHLFAAVDRKEVVKKNRERKAKEKADKARPATAATAAATAAPATGAAVPSAASAAAGASSKADRKHLHNYRVVQRNLVYIIGLPAAWGSEDMLRKPEFFGQYGRIAKVVVHRSSAAHSTISAYVTFVHKEDAKACIQALDNFWVDGHPLRASFGTTKYCNNFIRAVPCNNPDCVYLHELGEEDDRFTKEEIQQAGHTKLLPTPGRDQSIVSGGGGPSGTGKKPATEGILPPPVFLQDNAVLRRDAKVAEHKDARPGAAAAVDAKATLSRDKSHNNGDDGAERKSDASSAAASPPAAAQPSADSSITKAAETSLVSSQAFNGLSSNAVFPVPISSLAISLWSSVLRKSTTDLNCNPFSSLLLPFSDLLDLTLPPVDGGGPRLGAAAYDHTAAAAAVAQLHALR